MALLYTRQVIFSPGETLQQFKPHGSSMFKHGGGSNLAAVQSSRVQSVLEAGSNGSSRSKRSTVSLGS